jgi:hypothetical protein
MCTKQGSVTPPSLPADNLPWRGHGAFVARSVGHPPHRQQHQPEIAELANESVERRLDGQPIVTGWSYQWVVQLSFSGDIWTAPADVRRVESGHPPHFLVPGGPIA